MKILFTAALSLALFIFPLFLSAQSFKDKLKIVIPDGYTTQVESTTHIDVYTNPTTALVYQLDTMYSKKIENGWHFKSFSKDDVDDYLYLDIDFKANQWDSIADFASARFEKADVKSVYYNQLYISKYWDFRQMFLKIPMAQSVYDVYVNGMKIGSNLNTRNIATFDITPFVIEGSNPLIIVCRAENNVSKLEDNISNIPLLNGDVTLFSNHKLKITDYRVNTYFTDGLRNGNVQIDIDVKTHLINDKEARLMYAIYDREGNLVMRDERWTKMKMRDSYVVNFHTMIEDVKLYSAANPHIYKVVVALIHENRIAQTISINVPFIDVKCNESNYIINSQDVGLYGVLWNKCDTVRSDKEYKQSAIARISKFKANGFNAIMLEYPEREQFYSLCDSLGFYVVDRANVDIRSSGDSRGISGSFANIPSTANQITKRVLSQYRKTKNNPSVVALLGANSLTNGYSLYEMYLALKSVNKELILASNGLDLEWNNDFLIHYKTSEKVLKTDTTRLNFVVTDNTKHFNKYFDKVENRDIAGVFINEQQLDNEMRGGGYVKSVSITVLSAKHGIIVAESINTIIPKNEIKFIQELYFDDVKINEQVLPAIFGDVNKMEIILDYRKLNKIVLENQEMIENIENYKKGKFSVSISAVIGYSVIESVTFDFNPDK